MLEHVHELREVLRYAQDDKALGILLAHRKLFRHALDPCARI
jgi:hypothetical protein